MPELGPLHPQVVHFVVALLLLGVFLRWLSLTGHLRWTHPAAAFLLILGTVASVVAVSSGDDAHGPAERVPGARQAVVEHEEWGERTRNVFLGIALLEVVILAAGASRAGRVLRVVSAVAGAAGAVVLYEAAEHGGQLVYEYAGGVGTRKGNPEDVERLLVAGLYHQAQADRAAGRSDEAARLFEELVRRMPDDPGVRLLGIESLLRDRDDAAAARARLASLSVPEDNARARIQAGLLLVDAYAELGHADSAQSAVAELQREFPTNGRVRTRATELGVGGGEEE